MSCHARYRGLGSTCVGNKRKRKRNPSTFKDSVLASLAGISSWQVLKQELLVNLVGRFFVINIPNRPTAIQLAARPATPTSSVRTGGG
jgi:hypothetical protein